MTNKIQKENNSLDLPNYEPLRDELSKILENQRISFSEAKIKPDNEKSKFRYNFIMEKQLYKTLKMENNLQNNY